MRSSNMTRNPWIGSIYSMLRTRGWQAILYRPPQMLQTVAQLIEGKKVGVQKGTTSKEILELFKAETENGKFEVQEFPQVADVIDAVVKRTVDYGLTDTPFASAGQLQYGAEVLGYRELTGPDDFPKKLEQERHVEQYAIAVRKDEDELVVAINKIIDEMKEANKLGQLLQDSVTEFYALQKGKNPPVIDYRQDPSICRTN
jgi:ABC-type amino acid transport substrate-binding protein